MLDCVSLDHLRIFIAAADEGSFSGGGRRLRRAQSAVSQTLANLEGELAVKLFDRSRRYPVLTDQGRALLDEARAVVGEVDIFKARAKSLAGGLEPELSVAVDVLFPLAPFTAAVAAFQQEFPATLLRFDVESSAVLEPVLDGHCALGIWGTMGGWAPPPPQLTLEPLLTVRTHFVVSPQHPLAAHRAPIPPTLLGKHIQLVHADITDLAQADSPGLLSPRVWRLSHLGAKLAFLRAGLGFGLMPLHMIEADLASGALVRIGAESVPSDGYGMAMSAIYRTDRPPGRAGRWFIERLKEEERQLKERASRSPALIASPGKRPFERSPGRSLASKKKRRR
jgi:DNA-binding transcriptional LysR family regulator